MAARGNSTTDCWPSEDFGRQKGYTEPYRHMKQYHLAKGVGHYGIFNGSKWRERIAPVVEDWIAKHD